jgi:fumarate reductase subunit D
MRVFITLVCVVFLIWELNELLNQFIVVNLVTGGIVLITIFIFGIWVGQNRVHHEVLQLIDQYARKVKSLFQKA